MGNDPVPSLPSFAAATRVWARIGLLSFGGPAGQIALMHRELVDERRWISDARFLHALNFCTLLPGPEAMQLATYLGWLMHGVKGGLVGGGLFVLPGALVMLALSLIHATLGAVPLVSALFFGLKCAVLVLVVEALLRVARRALKSHEARALAGVTAGVVGVIANLALWFALHVLFMETRAVRAGPLELDLPLPTSFDPTALLLAAVAGGMLFGLKRGVGWTLGVSAAVALAIKLVS